jgi:hypothetical protein
MDYKYLEQEVKERKYNLTKPSWRGNLTKRGLKSIQWGDLKEIETQTLKSK